MKFKNMLQCLELCRMRPELQIIAVRLDIMMANDGAVEKTVTIKKVRRKLNQ